MKNADRRPLSEQVVVITGASSGIGREAALGFARHGARIVLAARGETRLQETARAVEAAGGTALVVPTDVASFAAVQALADAAVTRFGRIDTWIANAAVSAFATFDQLSVAEIDRTIQVDLLGTIYCAKAALPHLRAARQGAFIIVGSALGQRVVPLLSMYCTSKHALVGFADALRLELARDRLDISVTLVAPSSIDTPFYDHARSHMERRAAPPGIPYAPRLVADALVFAATHRRKTIYVGGSGVALLAAHRVSRTLVDRAMLVRDVMARDLLDREPPTRGDNLFTPSPGPSRSTGEKRRFVRQHSLYTWLQLHRGVASVTLGVGVAALALLGRVRRGA